MRKCHPCCRHSTRHHGGYPHGRAGLIGLVEGVINLATTAVHGGTHLVQRAVEGVVWHDGHHSCHNHHHCHHEHHPVTCVDVYHSDCCGPC